MNNSQSFSKWLISESRSKVLTKLENKFSKDVLYSEKLDYLPDEKTMKEVYDILNEDIFDGKLPNIKILCIPNDQILELFKKYKHDRNPNDFYALYFPIIDWKASIETKTYNKVHDDYLILSTSNGKMTFALAICMLCHEMIHCYDLYSGELLKYIQTEFSNRHQYDEHLTKNYQMFEKSAISKGLAIFPYGNDYDFKDLNKLAVYRMKKLEELDNELDSLSIKRKPRLHSFEENFTILPDGTLSPAIVFGD